MTSSPDDAQQPTPPVTSDLPVLTRPSDGVPDVVDDARGLAEAARRLAAGSGPIAIDTERAQGFRYTNRAYLIQLRRPGSGTVLVDPVPLVDEGHGLDPLREVLSTDQWILHAASQDLPCLAELDLLPPTLFDSELAARLLGYPRVALGTLTEELLGVRLLKEHSAADWSRRPLPEEWVTYAALDVELLHELREVLSAQLVAQGKQEWAAQEFEALVRWAGTPHESRQDRWRRTSGIHRVHTPLGLAVVRELWHTRDEIAARLDKAPGRILGDDAITQLAAEVKGQPVTVDRTTLRSIERFHRREAKRFESSWLGAVARVAALPRSELPPVTAPHDGPPNLRSWPRRFPEAAARWEAVRPAANAIAERLGLPPENLVAPEALRRLAWEPAGTDHADVDAQLAALGVRPWQRDLLAAPLAAELSRAASRRATAGTAPEPVSPSDEGSPS